MFLIRSWAIAFLTVFSTCNLLMADVSVSNQEDIVVRVSYDKVCDFIEKHPDEIIKSSHNEIIERDGAKVKLRNKNKQEVIIFTIREKTKRGLYSTEMLKCHQGGLKEQSTSISVAKIDKGRSSISIKANVTIDNPNIGPIEAKLEMHKSTKGIREYLKKHLN